MRSPAKHLDGLLRASRRSAITSGLANGDLIGDMTGRGVEVVACSTTIGCSLVTLQLSLVP